MNERFQIASKLISTHIVLPIGLCLANALIKNDVFLIFSITQSVLFILYKAGYWEFFGMRFRKIFYTGIELILLVLISSRLYRGDYINPGLANVILLSVVQLLLLIEIIKIIIVTFEDSKSASEIEFPFRKGYYLVTDGGNSKISRLMNYHFHSSLHKKMNTNRSMLYATDVVKLDPDFVRFLPLKNEDYPIFNENIISPLEGKVVKVVNNIEDNLPFSGNYPYNTGNTIVIQKDNKYLLLGHLKKGSIKVNEGEVVKTGDIVAVAGNSGYSERPHLHMQLIESDTPDYWKGTGISLTHLNNNLYKNRLIKK